MSLPAAITPPCHAIAAPDMPFTFTLFMSCLPPDAYYCRYFRLTMFFMISNAKHYFHVIVSLTFLRFVTFLQHYLSLDACPARLIECKMRRALRAALRASVMMFARRYFDMRAASRCVGDARYARRFTFYDYYHAL